jgi:hypothetical protein
MKMNSKVLQEIAAEVPYALLSQGSVAVGLQPGEPKRTPNLLSGRNPSSNSN